MRLPWSLPLPWWPCCPPLAGRGAGVPAPPAGLLPLLGVLLAGLAHLGQELVLGLRPPASQLRQVLGLEVADHLGGVVDGAAELAQEHRVLAQPLAVPGGHGRQGGGGVPLPVLVTAVGAGEVLAGLVEVVGQLARCCPACLSRARLGRDA